MQSRCDVTDVLWLDCCQQNWACWPILVSVNSRPFGSSLLSALVLTRPAETEILQLSTNTLTGMIPTEIGLAPKLTLINVARNQLSGMLPSEIGQLMVLGTFGVSQSV